MKKIILFAFLLGNVALYGQSTVATINKGYKLNAGQYLDTRMGTILAGKSVPYSGVSAANAAIFPAFRCVGMTVLIDTLGSMKEYWYLAGTANGNLVPKETGSTYTAGYGMLLSSGAFSTDTTTITSRPRLAAALALKEDALAVSNGITKATGTLKLGGELTQNTSIDAGDYRFIITGLRSVDGATGGVVYVDTAGVEMVKSTAFGVLKNAIKINHQGTLFKKGINTYLVLDTIPKTTVGFPALVYDTITKEVKRGYISGSGANFANADLTFTGNRTHDAGAYDLNIVNINKFKFISNESSIEDDGDSLSVRNNSKVNISAPALRLDITGKALNKVLTSDADGNATWQTPSSASGWSLTGNAGTTAGTNFIGTTDNQDLVFKRNNTRVGLFNEHSIYWGERTGSSLNSFGGNQDVFIGYGAGTEYKGDSAFGNVVIGGEAGHFMVEAQANVMIGHQAGNQTVRGNENVFIGRDAGGDNENGSGNVYLGKDAGRNRRNGTTNTYIGTEAGGGANSVFPLNNEQNTAIGYQAGYNNYGYNNVFLGANAGILDSIGHGNIFLGSYAGHHTYGSNKLIVYGGDNSTGSAANDSTKSIIYGYQAPHISNQKLRINGHLQINDSTQGAGKVFTSDANGVGSWQTPSGGSGTEVYNEPSTGFTGTSMSTTNTPTTGTLRLFKNGIRLVLGYDYTITGSTVTLAVAAVSSDYFIKDYKY